MDCESSLVQCISDPNFFSWLHLALVSEKRNRMILPKLFDPIHCVLLCLTMETTTPHTLSNLFDVREDCFHLCQNRSKVVVTWCDILHIALAASRRGAGKHSLWEMQLMFKCFDLEYAMVCLKDLNLLFVISMYIKVEDQGFMANWKNSYTFNYNNC